MLPKCPQNSLGTHSMQLYHHFGIPGIYTKHLQAALNLKCNRKVMLAIYGVVFSYAFKTIWFNSYGISQYF